MSDGGPADRTPGALIGRTDDLEFITAFTDQAARTGGALLLSGEAGVGKTVLLDAAAVHAEAAGRRVLRAAGAEFEGVVSFAGLNQLLHPLLDQLAGLSAAYRRALAVALGVRQGSPPDQLMLANATLALLAQASPAGPVLVVVDDLPWLDRASALVLGVVARRLGGTRIGFLAGSRSGEDGFFDRGGLPVHEVLPLSAAAAAELVVDRFPALAPPVRQRLLAEAQGNPLALLELPLALRGLPRSGTGPLPDLLPLSRRLQAAFESRIIALPAPARHLLLLAALDGTGSLPTPPPAAAPERHGTDELAPAERAGLVHVGGDGSRLEFRHPLTRSAVVALSTSAERRRAHAALARLLTDDPDRRAWHLAQAATGPDEPVARLLEQAAYRISRRGDAAGAVTMLLRAADLTPPGAGRSRRLAEAAYLGVVVTGDLRDVPRLLDDARKADGGRAVSLVASVAAAQHLQLSGDGDIDTAHQLLAGAIEMQPEPYDAASGTMVEALYALAWVCYFGGRAELWAPFDRALTRLKPEVPELLTLVSATFADPARTVLPALARLDDAVAALNEQTDPVWVARVGLACMFVDRLTGCRSALWRILRAGREGRVITLSLHALSLLGLDHFMTGEWDMAQALADEHVSLCRAHHYRLLECRGLYLQAMLAAARGDDAASRTMTDQMTRWATPRRVGAIHRLAAQARTLAALTRGDFEAAYEHASTITPPGQLADHVPHALWLTLDLAEAAVRTGRPAEAVAHVAAVRQAGLTAISPRQALIIEGAAAIAAPDQEAAALFERALAVPGTDRWPFDRARIQLAFGERLRRMKATTGARAQLTAALDTFQRLGAGPWAVRAGSELRATGLTVSALAGTGPASLTPQQREIATLAATGLTNKQIAERLFLSPSTVATHLHQLFPKLGVTTRAALRDALAGPPPESP